MVKEVFSVKTNKNVSLESAKRYLRLIKAENTVENLIANGYLPLENQVMVNVKGGNTVLKFNEIEKKDIDIEKAVFRNESNRQKYFEKANKGYEVEVKEYEYKKVVEKKIVRGKERDVLGTEKVYKESKKYKYIPTTNFQNFTLRINSDDGIKNFIKDMKKKYKNVNIRAVFTDFRVGENKIFYSTKSVPIQDFEDAIIDTYNKFIEKETSYEGQFIGLEFDEFIAGPIQIYFIQTNGGCNSNGHHSKNKVVINGKNFGIKHICEKIAVYDPLVDGKSNNCGLACIKLMNDNIPSFSKIRKEFGLTSKEKISVEKMYEIRDKYKMKFSILDIAFREVLTGKKMDTSGDIIILKDNHYYVLKDIEDRKAYCHNCGVKYVKTNGHNCSNEKTLKFKKFVLRGKSKTIERLYLDFESRNDLLDYNIVNGKKYYKQIPTLIKVSKLDKNGNKVLYFSCLGVDCVSQFINKIVEDNYNGKVYNFYGHNAGSFDYYFIYGEILKNYKWRKSLVNIVIKNSKILMMNFNENYFFDTFNFMASSLDSLCKSFKVPENYSKIKNVVIDGKEMSSMELCLLHPELGPQEFIDFLNENQEYKKAYEEYCEYDTYSLAYIHSSFLKNMYEIISEIKSNCSKIQKSELDDIKVEECFTLPSLAHKILFSTNINKYIVARRSESNIYNIEDKEIREFFKKAKIGGISHCNKPGWYKDSEIACIDVVSLYVSAMLKFEYPEGAPIKTNTYMKGKLGVYLVKNIKFEKDGIQDVPLRTKNGLDWTSKEIPELHITNIDIERMKEHNATFDIVEGYYFEKSHNPFRNCLEPITKQKVLQDSYMESKSDLYNPALRECCKLLGNSMYGKLLETSSKDSVEIFGNMNEVPEDKFVGAKSISIVNDSVILRSPVDKDNAPIQYGIFVLAYSRSIIQKYFEIVGRDNVIQTETDSIYCPLSALDKLKESKDSFYKIGKDWGNMDVENGDKNYIKEAFFGAKKLYGLFEIINPKVGKEKKFRCKGIPGRHLNKEFYKKIYDNDGEILVSGIVNFQRNLHNSTDTNVRVGKIDKKINTKTKYQTLSVK